VRYQGAQEPRGRSHITHRTPHPFPSGWNADHVEPVQGAPFPTPGLPRSGSPRRGPVPLRQPEVELAGGLDVVQVVGRVARSGGSGDSERPHRAPYATRRAQTSNVGEAGFDAASGKTAATCARHGEILEKAQVPSSPDAPRSDARSRVVGYWVVSALQTSQGPPTPRNRGVSGFRA
jgi:hypothetical protein